MDGVAEERVQVLGWCRVRRSHQYPCSRSGCTVGSTGYQEKSRECLHQSRLVHTVQGCPGPATGFDFCDDTNLCGQRRDTTQ